MANRSRPNISLSSPEASAILREAQRAVLERRAQGVPPPPTWEEIQQDMRQDMLSRSAQEAQEQDRLHRAAQALAREQDRTRRLQSIDRMRRLQIDAKTLEGKDIEVDDNPEVSVEMLRCPICQTNVKDIRLSPCGHMICKTCAIHLRSLNQGCPICRQSITSIDKVYYNKYLKYKNKYVMLRNKISQH